MENSKNLSRILNFFREHFSGGVVWILYYYHYYHYYYYYYYSYYSRAGDRLPLLCELWCTCLGLCIPTAPRLRALPTMPMYVFFERVCG